ncbi:MULTISPECIES: adenylate/guanylate cyclase domain-containing protein [Cyanophyceae]|uniref:adenylate/guanylate cyclase domain-containing protein n=1 Tax=Cyanophyceae TaxID=3028117 RepID=UPI00168514DC|nr:adenylate/guanylate cyclase domain-containing protein [Trichocoleus sp. FACHB-69]MBD1931395.1 FHA domain-containing protein [Trichocoleus sp. FACHB-69]
MAELKLRQQIEGKTESYITVEKEEFTIGRLPECDLYLPYFEISRYHARLVKAPDRGWLIEDMHSTNGTRLNERLLTSPQKVNHGDVIQLGHICLNVIFTDPPQPQKPVTYPLADEAMTIFRSAEELQQQWIQADDNGDRSSNHQKAIDRLKDMVDIAKSLNSAESIEAIFAQVQEIVFRNLKSIERLALLVDINDSGKLELLDAAARDISQQENITADDSWISRTICQKVFTDKLAVKTADAQRDERFVGEQSILAKGIRSALAVPLWDEHHVVGVLYGDANLSFNHYAKGGEEDLSFFSALANLVASAVQRWLLTQKLRSEANIRHRLERYHSPSVVQHIMTQGALEDGRLVPSEGEISILFADIVGFTALSEKLTPTQIAHLLNNFFEEMLQEIFHAGGTLDKFIGDCIMAFFGAPEPQPDHAERAVASAWGMLERLDRLNTCRFFPEPLQLRIAINSGKAVVGDVGSSQRVDYTVLGTTINLASRMEGICPPGEFVISEKTYSMLKRTKGLSAMGEFRFKGIDRPIQVYQTKRH